MKKSRRSFMHKAAGLGMGTSLLAPSVGWAGGGHLWDQEGDRTMQTSDITNNWGKVNLKKIKTEHAYIHKGDEQTAYHHHHQITSMNGKLFASFSDGFRDEDQAGQRGLLRISEDWGKTWGDSIPFADRKPGFRKWGVVTPEGIHANDGKLTGYYGYVDFTKVSFMMYYAAGGNQHLKMMMPQRSYQNTHTGIVVSEDEGQTWVDTGKRIDRFFPNMGPFKTSRGRLILPGHVTFAYTDDPYGVDGWVKVDLPGLSENFIDDPNGIHFAGKELGLGFEPQEASCFELEDGTLRAMFRTDLKRLAVSMSKDHGESWSTPKLTDYTDCNCRHHFGRLPDGRYFGLNCPEPSSVRTPMVLAVSKDALNFDKHFVLGDEEYTLFRVPGNHKYGRYGYPSIHFEGETAFVIYSVNKEDIAMCTFKLSELS